MARIRDIIRRFTWTWISTFTINLCRHFCVDSIIAVETGIYQHKDKIQPGKVFLYSYHAFVLWNIIATFWVTNTALIAGFMAIFVNAAFMAP
jgi:hypothetical protein